MASDYPEMPGSDDAAPSEAESEAPMESPEREDEGMEGETALLPSSILGGKEFKPGDEVVLKIIHMGDGEIEVAYAPEKGKRGSGGGGGTEMDDAMQKMGDYAAE